MIKKTFVLDTNVLLHDPESITKFPHNNVVIPVSVLEELDRMKRFPNELGKNSRAVFRFLDAIARKGEGDLHNGIELDNKSKIRISIHVKVEGDGKNGHPPIDNKIIIAAYNLHSKGEKVVFVSKDFAARIKAEALGLEAQDYENLKFSYDALYRGLRHIETTKQNIDFFYKDGVIEIDGLEPRPNEYFVMTSPEHSSAVGKFDPSAGKISSLLKVPNIWGVKPRNVEQRCAIDMLLRDDIKLITLIGPAGTGKTLLALACAMRKVFDEGHYNRILVSRPVMPLGRDIGYLPGTKEEKLFHWMQPIYDNLEYLCESTDGNGHKETLEWVMNSKKIEMEAVTYIRGRSLPNSVIIVDEAQNLTPHEVKTIISRAGDGTKVILTGDPEQIDNPYLDKDSNGLTYVVGKFNDYKIYGHIFMDKTERSQLAAIAADIL